MREQTLGELLAAIGARTPAPASGSVAALTGAVAAALAEMAARFAEDDAAVEQAQAFGRRLIELAEEDAAAYSAFLASRNEETRAAIVRVPEEIAAAAGEVAAIAEGVRTLLAPSIGADAEVARTLAETAAAVARRLVDINV